MSDINQETWEMGSSLMEVVASDSDGCFIVQSKTDKNKDG